MSIIITATSPVLSNNSLTALEIMQETMAELGLPVPGTIEDSTDTLTYQALILLNSAGRELVEGYPWQFLVRNYAVTTIDTQALYALPDDWSYLAENTGWNHAVGAVWPILGPKSTTEWAFLNSGYDSVGTRIRYRLVGNQLEFYPTPSSAESRSFSYVSACWVENSDPGHPGTLIDRIVLNDDRPLINSTLLKKLLKIKVRASKGLDTTSVVEEFKILFDAIVKRDAPNTTIQAQAASIIQVLADPPLLAENAMSILQIVQEAMAELDMPVPFNLFNYGDVVSQKLLILVNAVGRELLEAYPWQFLVQHWELETVNGIDSYALPTDWAYALDQSQWDQTNHWPLLGPKTAAEWAYLKSGIVSSGPRIRYRMKGNKMYVHPVPGASVWTLVMDYISSCWVATQYEATYVANQISQDTDRPLFNSQLFKRLLKIKLVADKIDSPYDVAALQNDFMSYFSKLVGKDVGGAMLSLTQNPGTYLVGVGNIIDGNWPT